MAAFLILTFTLSLVPAAEALAASGSRAHVYGPLGRATRLRDQVGRDEPRIGQLARTTHLVEDVVHAERRLIERQATRNGERTRELHLAFARAHLLRRAARRECDDEARRLRARRGFAAAAERDVEARERAPRTGLERGIAAEAARKIVVLPGIRVGTRVLERLVVRCRAAACDDAGRDPRRVRHPAHRRVEGVLAARVRYALAKAIGGGRHAEVRRRRDGRRRRLDGLTRVAERVRVSGRPVRLRRQVAAARRAVGKRRVVGRQPAAVLGRATGGVRPAVVVEVRDRPLRRVEIETHALPRRQRVAGLELGNRERGAVGAVGLPECRRRSLIR